MCLIVIIFPLTSLLNFVFLCSFSAQLSGVYFFEYVCRGFAAKARPEVRLTSSLYTFLSSVGLQELANVWCRAAMFDCIPSLFVLIGPGLPLPTYPVLDSNDLHSVNEFNERFLKNDLRMTKIVASY